MHIHFIGIGGAGIGPLAQTAFKADYLVSGSDINNSSYIDYLKSKGIDNIQIGPATDILSQVQSNTPIDWLVYTSAMTQADPNPEVLKKAKLLGIKSTKRDDFINYLLDRSGQKMLAIAGTHGKTTTTAMVAWIFKQLNIPASHIIPAKTSFSDMGEFNKSAKYFIYEADEFDHNFLAFNPELSLISGVSWDHHEIFPTREEYIAAFVQFISQSQQSLLWQSDADYLSLSDGKIKILDDNDPAISQIKLAGLFNRRDALLAAHSVAQLTDVDLDKAIEVLNSFPGLSRRMEEIIPGLYSDYAHTPERIKAAIDVAKDMFKDKDKKIIIVYEPLTNRRQTYIKDDYIDCFKGASKVYWLDSYLAREDPKTPIIAPSELIQGLSDPSIAEPASMNEELKANIGRHIDDGDMVVCLAGGGSGSLDDWVKDQFAAS